MGTSSSTLQVTGKTPLIEAIRNQNYNTAYQLANSSSKNHVSTWYTETALTDQQKTGNANGKAKQVHTTDGLMVRILPLHLACELNAPSKFIECLVQIFPDACQLADHPSGWLPIHFAASGFGVDNPNDPNIKNASPGTSSKKMNLILSVHPQGAMQKDKLGRVPLHIAFEVGSSVPRMVESLLQACPEATKVKDKEGRLPLHCACATRALTEETLISLLQANPESASIRDFRGRTSIEIMEANQIHPYKLVLLDILKRDKLEFIPPEERALILDKRNISTVMTELHSLINRTLWDRVVGRCVETPHEASMWYTLQDRSGRVWSKHLPLHEALQRDAPLAVIKILIRTYNDGVKFKDHNGDYAIHHACEYCLENLQLIEYLVETYPTCLELPNSKGMLPIHSAIWGGTSKEILRFLLEKFPDSIRVRDTFGRSCIKIAQIRKNRELVYLLAEQSAAVELETKSSEIMPSFSTGTGYESRNHKSELHRLIGLKRWDEAIEHCQQSPFDATEWYVVHDAAGRILSRILPIHLACQMQPPKELVDILLQAAPQSVRSRGNGHALPIHNACAYGASKDVVRMLLRAYPESKLLKDNDGRTPIDYARDSLHPTKDAIELLLKSGEDVLDSPRPPSSTSYQYESSPNSVVSPPHSALLSVEELSKSYSYSSPPVQ